MSSRWQEGRMITPIIIQVVYWILVVLVVAGALAAIAVPPATVLILIVGLLAVRVIAELPMLVFRMGQTVSDLKDLTFQRIRTSNPIPLHDEHLRVRDYITFRRMITPNILQGLTVLLAIGFFVGLIATFVGAGQAGMSPDFLVGTVIAYCAFFALLLLVVRIITEVLFAVFGINENLSDMRNLLRAASTDSNASDGVRLKSMGLPDVSSYGHADPHTGAVLDSPSVFLVWGLGGPLWSDRKRRRDKSTLELLVGGSGPGFRSPNCTDSY